MKNFDIIIKTIEIIEDDLSEDLSLDNLSLKIGYSKYHLHKMFTAVVGMPIHQYIKKRRLSEAAKLLMITPDRIIDIGLKAGYESQQAFSDAFKSEYKIRPKTLRKQLKKLSLLPRFTSSNDQLRGEEIMNVRIEESVELSLVGYHVKTIKGFFQIPRLWAKLHKNKHLNNRVHNDWTFAFNDYSNADFNDHTTFDYYACIAVKNEDHLEVDMTYKALPNSRYVVFTVQGDPKASMEKTVEYIYKQWFPTSTYVLNENAKYDFIRYSEITDDKGHGDIEVWIPIK